MIPKIIFRYSWIYDNKFRASPKINAMLKKNNKQYPSKEKIIAYKEKIMKEWEEIDKKILKELSSISGLRWKEKEIKCYMIGVGIPFSDPLTISILRFNKAEFIDTLIHELIHQLFINEGNFEKSYKARRYFHEKYKKEDLETRIHIPLHAIHKHIYLKHFSKKRLQRDYDNIKHNKAYKRSWDIVNAEGHEKIIKEFRSRIK